MKNFMWKNDFTDLMKKYDLSNEKDHTLNSRIVHCLSILEKTKSLPVLRSDLAEYLNIPPSELANFFLMTNSFRLLHRYFFTVLITDATTIFGSKALPEPCHKPLSRETIESIFPGILMFKYFTKLASLERFVEKTEKQKLRDQGYYSSVDKPIRVRKSMLPLKEAKDYIDFSDVI